MNREDQDFVQLRRLLKLKRYEQPPPRFFNDFSSHVVARLKAHQSSGGGDSWWQRLWAGLELRPAFPVALSIAVCGLLVFGAVYSEKAEVSQELLQLTGGQINHHQRLNGDAPTLATIGQVPQLALGSSSTNPVPVVETLFNRVSPVEIMRASHPMFR